VRDRERKHGVAAAVDVTPLGRFSERFGDHAVVMARWVTFQATANCSVQSTKIPLTSVRPGR
jgi:phosphate transport system protein